MQSMIAFLTNDVANKAKYQSESIFEKSKR